jgi:hypothetical protein
MKAIGTPPLDNQFATFLPADGHLVNQSLAAGEVYNWLHRGLTSTLRGSPTRWRMPSNNDPIIYKGIWG